MADHFHSGDSLTDKENLVLALCGNRGTVTSGDYAFWRDKQGRIFSDTTNADAYPASDLSPAIVSLLDRGYMVAVKDRDPDNRRAEHLLPTFLQDWIDLDGELHLIEFGDRLTGDCVMEIDQQSPAVRLISSRRRLMNVAFCPDGEAITLSDGTKGTLIITDDHQRIRYERLHNPDAQPHPSRPCRAHPRERKPAA